MPWFFDRSIGLLTHVVGDGREADMSFPAYAGQPPFVNSVKDDWRECLGPLPAGRYMIGLPIADGGHLGPYVMELTPMPDNNMKGRSGFYIHGDSLSHPGYASEGCIVPAGGRATREAIGTSYDHILEVL
jgi:hypothetical protein